jgi:two-component system, LytTR family, response regulator
MQNTKILKAVIIDDSQDSISSFTKIIEHFFSSEIKIIKTFISGKEALQELEDLNLDVLFLDIEMPEINGFELKSQLPKSFNAKIVILSGKEHYAIQGIKEQVFDYLTKPIVLTELKDCIKKISAEKANEQESVPFDQNKIMVVTHSKTHFFDINKIVRIAAKGPYSIVHFEDKEISISKNLGQFENILPKNLFKRIHRSHLINIDYLMEIRKNPNSSEVIMRDGAKIEVANLKKNELF